MRLKYSQISLLFIKVIRQKCEITGQYLYSHHFTKLLKESFTIDCNYTHTHTHICVCVRAHAQEYYYNIYIYCNNILAQEEYGFRTNSSTELATYNRTNNNLTALDNKLLVGGLFCDLTKASDCVKHDILLAKFEYYGFNGKAGDLIKSYLYERYQRVII